LSTIFSLSLDRTVNNSVWIISITKTSDKSSRVTITGAWNIKGVWQIFSFVRTMEETLMAFANSFDPNEMHTASHCDPCCLEMDIVNISKTQRSPKIFREMVRLNQKNFNEQIGQYFVIFKVFKDTASINEKRNVILHYMAIWKFQ